MSLFGGTMLSVGEAVLPFLSQLLFDFFPELLGAGLGAYLGYRYGIRQERQMRKEEEKELKKETIKSLLKELDLNCTILGDKTVMTLNISPTKKNPCDIVPLITSSYNSAVTSGRFSLLSPTNQISLSAYYEECKRIMNKVSMVETTYRISNEDIQSYIDQINEIGEPLSDYIIEIQEYIKSELDDIT